MIQAIIRPDGSITVDDLPTNLSWYQDLVGGFIEVWSRGEITFIFNEDGKEKKLPVNRTASLLAMLIEPLFSDLIVGNVVINGRRGGEITELPPAMVALLDLLASARPGLDDGDVVVSEQHMDFVIGQVRTTEDGQHAFLTDTAENYHQALVKAFKLGEKTSGSRVWKQRPDGGYAIVHSASENL